MHGNSLFTEGRPLKDCPWLQLFVRVLALGPGTVGEQAEVPRSYTLSDVCRNMVTAVFCNSVSQSKQLTRRRKYGQYHTLHIDVQHLSLQHQVAHHIGYGCLLQMGASCPDLLSGGDMAYSRG